MKSDIPIIIDPSKLGIDHNSRSDIANIETNSDDFSLIDRRIDSINSLNNNINNIVSKNPIPSAITDTTTTTFETITPPITTISSELFTSSKPSSREKRSIFNYSQTQKVELPTAMRSSTTLRPRTRYDDEGKWKIIRQEEKKQPKAYDYL